MPEGTGSQAAVRLSIGDVVSVHVMMRQVHCVCSPSRGTHELDISGKEQWRLGRVSATQVTLALREGISARQMDEQNTDAARLSIELEAEAQIVLSREVSHLDPSDEELLVGMCRPYLHEIVAYLTGRMGITPLLLPSAWGKMVQQALPLPGGGNEHAGDGPGD